MDFITNYTTEEYALTASWQDFPKQVQQQAKMCAIDLTAALILGSYGKQFEAGIKIARTCGMTGEIGIIGSNEKFNLLGAAIAMGHASNSFDIDDGHRMIQGHPGTSFIAGTLAAACQKNITIGQFIETLVVCYELTIRWALVMQQDYKFLHSTGTYGAFGTAIGIGRTLGLTKQQLNNALSIADYHAPLTPVMRAVEYPSMNKDGVPFGALVGTMAIIETLCGSTGKTHLLEKSDYRPYVDDLGKKYHILDLYFKPYTCCRWAHQPIQAIVDLKKANNFVHDDIVSVEVRTFNSAARLSKKIPTDSEEAQYNIAYPVACAIVHGDVGFAQMREQAIPDKDVISVMDKLSFVVEEEYDRQFPAKRLASVKIDLKNGKTLQSRVYEAPGEPDDSNLNIGWIIDKFKRVTAPMLDADSQSSIIDAIINNDGMLMRDLIEMINQSLKKNI